MEGLLVGWRFDSYCSEIVLSLARLRPPVQVDFMEVAGLRLCMSDCTSIGEVMRTEAICALASRNQDRDTVTVRCVIPGRQTPAMEQVTATRRAG